MENVRFHITCKGIVIYKHKILILKRVRASSDGLGYWELPGGGLEYGETPEMIECFCPSTDIELSKDEIKTLKKIINSTPESIKYLSGRISNSEELYYEALESDPYTYGLIFTQNLNGHGVYSSNSQLVEKIFKKYKINEDTLIEWSKTPTVINVENTLI